MRSYSPPPLFDLDELLAMVDSKETKLVAEAIEILHRYGWLQNGVLSNKDLSNINLNGADLSNANLTGVKLHNAKLFHANLNGTSLVKANLRGAYLVDANLQNVKASEARFYGTVLARANLINANLSKSVLIKSVLSDAILRNTNLTGANLRQAALNRTFLDNSLTVDCDFSEAVCGYTVFSNLDLSLAKNLDKIQHNAPSTVGIDTIYLSKGKIDETFLRGCALPETLIQSIPRLVNKSNSRLSTFISHSSKDEFFCDYLAEKMRLEDVPRWYAPQDTEGRTPTKDQILQAIHQQDIFVLVLSEASIRSGWVETELSIAVKRQREEGKQILYPIRLVPMEIIQKWECFDSDLGIDLAKAIRACNILDFTDWQNPASFQKMFARFLEGLKRA